MRTQVHATEAAIRLMDQHGQTVIVDLLPENLASVTVEITKMLSPQESPSSIVFMVQVMVPPGVPCEHCGQVHPEDDPEQHGETEPTEA